MHFGIITPPVPGHVHPFGALGRELIARGHRVTVLHMEDLRVKVQAEDLEFLPIGHADHPPGSLAESLRHLGSLSGLAALRFTINAVAKTTEMFCRDAPDQIRGAGIKALLVDQTEPAGCAIAEHLRIPFITVCNALNLNEEPGVPPPFTAWRFENSFWARTRNSIGYSVARQMMAPLAQAIAKHRKRWALKPHLRPSDSFSPLAQISQSPPGFDYPRKLLPSTFHYTGPLRRAGTKEISFPWSSLNGKPLVYASLGTLQNGRNRLFRIFAEACAPLEVQLVLAGVDLESIGPLPGDTLAVSYAPQLEVLSKASLTVTHGGLNTVLDSLSWGVPMVTIPINYEQPAIAERVRWSGSGLTVPFSSVSETNLRDAIQEVLSKPRFQQSAATLARNISDAGGVQRAARVIESLMK